MAPIPSRAEITQAALIMRSHFAAVSGTLWSNNPFPGNSQDRPQDLSQHSRSGAHDPSGLWQESRALAGPDILSMGRV